MSDTDVRDHLLRALEHDLVGPFQEDELVPLPPSRWYLTGFLAPQGGRDPVDPTAEDELGAGSDEDEEETTGQEPEPKQKKRYPASLGLSVLLPPGPEADAIQATVSWAEYVVETVTEEARAKTCWRRVPREPVTVDVPLNSKTLAKGIDLTTNADADADADEKRPTATA